MFETYKLKKAKAKLELESINKQLNEIKAQKEKERWDRMPLWERNIEIEILKEKAGLIEREKKSVAYKLTVSITATLLIFGFIYLIYTVLTGTLGVLPTETTHISTWQSLIINVGGWFFTVLFGAILAWIIYDWLG